jgi:hypothetical protein
MARHCRVTKSSSIKMQGATSMLKVNDFKKKSLWLRGPAWLIRVSKMAIIRMAMCLQSPELRDSERALTCSVKAL